MSKTLLIDAAYPEEIRVAVVAGGKMEKIEYHSEKQAQQRGNIYLGQVVSIEPSLQAAFVEYGSNRHGFLSMDQIHPDYYQIPQQDRLDLESAALQTEDEIAAENENSESGDMSETDYAPCDETRETHDTDTDTASAPPQSRPRRYRIQEVIKRRQIVLVKVLKEERGTKGAMLTTYLSLAGRYCVLMPNAGRSGGISRKISDDKQRSGLRSILKSLDIPEGMGLIIRTAGERATKTEIHNDFEYLLQLWVRIRDLTLSSKMPCLIYQDSTPVKRAMRDLCNKDISEIIVEGKAAWLEAKLFMKIMMPDQARHVHHYQENEPLFHRYGIEKQIEALFNQRVTLPSGGTIIINETEALIAIDVNSGRAIGEHSIEKTAYKANLEACEAIAAQLMLRDLSGLIVIDFIDMEESVHIRAVERHLRQCLKEDRARIRLGRVSSFGLLEMSRQRTRPNFIELNTVPCPGCAHNGSAGWIRAQRVTGLSLLRALRASPAPAESSHEGTVTALRVTLDKEILAYLVNEKREDLNTILTTAPMPINLELQNGSGISGFELSWHPCRHRAIPGIQDAVMPETLLLSQDEQIEDTASADAEAQKSKSSSSRRRRRGGRGRGRRRIEESSGEATPDAAADATSAMMADSTTPTPADTETVAEIASSGELPISAPGDQAPI